MTSLPVTYATSAWTTRLIRKRKTTAMKMAIKDGQLLIKDVDNYQFQVIKSWNKMRWDKADKMLYAPVEAELLNKLSALVKLPPLIEEERKRMNSITAAVDAERMNEHPEPMYPYPVKLKLFDHQVRAANMAMMTFGLIDPREVTDSDIGT